MTTNLKMNRNIAKKIRQRFDERVAIATDARNNNAVVTLGWDTFECNGFKVRLFTSYDYVHAIVVEISGVDIWVRDAQSVYVGKGNVKFIPDRGPCVVFDVANGPRKP